MRPTLFRLASDTEDSDEALGERVALIYAASPGKSRYEVNHRSPFSLTPSTLRAADILQANDSLTQVINLYRQLVKGEDVSKDGTATPPQTSMSSRLSVSVSARGLRLTIILAVHESV